MILFQLTRPQKRTPRHSVREISLFFTIFIGVLIAIPSLQPGDPAPIGSYAPPPPPMSKGVDLEYLTSSLPEAQGMEENFSDPDDEDASRVPMIISGFIILIIVIVVSYFTLKEQERQRQERKERRRTERRERKMKERSEKGKQRETERKKKRTREPRMRKRGNESKKDGSEGNDTVILDP